MGFLSSPLKPAVEVPLPALAQPNPPIRADVAAPAGTTSAAQAMLVQPNAIPDPAVPGVVPAGNARLSTATGHPQCPSIIPLASSAVDVASNAAGTGLRPGEPGDQGHVPLVAHGSAASEEMPVQAAIPPLPSQPIPAITTDQRSPR